MHGFLKQLGWYREVDRPCSSGQSLAWLYRRHTRTMWSVPCAEVAWVAGLNRSIPTKYFIVYLRIALGIFIPFEDGEGKN